MCGRFAMDDSTNEMLEQIVAEHGTAALADWQRYWPPNYNVAPTDEVPIVRVRHGEREVVPARWAMVPPGSPTFGGGKPVFNARIETVDTLGLFKQPFAQARAIVPALGYYEWKVAADGGKDPFFIRERGGPMALAGLWRAWRDKSKDADDPGAWRISMAIITMDAHAVPGDVHDRQPAFLTPEQFDDWLGDSLGPADLKRLLQDGSEAVREEIEFYPVSRSVNRVKVDGRPNTGPELIEPAT
ncbi:MAG TPA: SOS response-associated peptidase [Rhodoglobus sp.]|nr:SOS response-associated peptidase [Rhodoglobus sp.]